MRNILYLISLCLLLICGCVTEREDKPDDGVAYLKKEIKKIVDRLPYQTGMDLYRDLNHLAAFEEYAIEPMMECLKHENSKVRASAALVLGQLRAKEALDPLLDAMKDENKWVRLESARAVLEIGAWNAVPILLQGLNDPDLQTRSLCAEILEQKVGETFGYDPKASESERAASILQWNRWWEEKKGDPSVEGNLVSR